MRFSSVIPARACASQDAQWRIRESMTTIGSMDSGQPLRGFRNDGLVCFNRSQKYLGLFACRKASNFAIVGLVLGRIGRADCDELVANLLDKLCQIFALERRHVPYAAMRAFVVAHAGPLVGPYPVAAGASVDIEKPGHTYPLGSQAIITTRDEFEKPAITQVLKLLPNFWSNVLVPRMKLAEMPFESVDIVKRKISFAE
jgi:hypothetical protein